MKKALFNEIFGLMKELGIKLQLGTRTNVKRHPGVKHFGKDLVSDTLLTEQIEKGGVDKVLKVFEGEAAYIPQFDDYQGKTFLKNLNKLKTVLHPAPPKPSNVVEYMDPEGLGGLKIKKEVEATRKDMKELGLDPNNHQHQLEFHKGIGSMFKKVDDPGSVVPAPKTTDEIVRGIDQELTPNLIEEPPVSIVDEMDNITKEGESLQSHIEKLKKLTFEMSPEYEAQQQAKNKLRYKLRYEGKGFSGGMQKEGYFRAVVRPFLIREHDAGKIKLSDSVYKSLKDMTDLSSGGFNDQMYPDPIRVFRHHYGDNAFDIIPPDIPSPARSDILQAFDEARIQPITAQGPRNTGGYLTAGEYRGKMADINDSIKAIEEGGGRFDAMTRDEKLKEIAEVNLRKETLKKAFKQNHPGELIGTETFDELTLWGQKPEDFAEGGRVGLRAGGGAFKKFIEGLFIKASNDIRLGKGVWKGLDIKQKTQQHDNLTKIVDKFMKTGEFDQRANEYFGLDAEIAFAEAQGKTFLKGPQKMPSSHQENKILDAAYEDVAHHLKLEDLKYEADVLADSYANQLGKVYDDMADAERSALYDQSYRRLASNLKVQMDLKKMEQKAILGEFDPKGRKPNAFGGGVGSMFKERVGYQPGGRVLAKGAVWFLRAMKKNLEDMLAGHPRFEKIPKEELDVISQQMQFMIREMESGKEVPIEALQAIKDNPNYYRSGRVTRAQDPDMAEVEELIVEKLGGDEVGEVLAGFDVTKRKPNAAGGGVGSMFRRV